MLPEIVDIVQSLTAIMEEESDKLVAPSRHSDLGELAAAKTRLVAALEARLAQLGRERGNWLGELDGAEREQLGAAMQCLRDASRANATILARQIELSTEMMAAVAAEAQRLTGSRNATYSARGGLLRMDQATPISLNTSL